MCLASFFLRSTPSDVLLPDQSVKDGETLVSAGKTFALGFFSPENTTHRYIRIWYHSIPDEDIGWVANREKPLPNASGVVTIVHNNLVILDESRQPIMSATVGLNATSARLLDSGNLVVNDSQGRMLWQSFDYPTNTMLPGLKIGIDYRTGLERSLTSWKAPNDPARGEFSLGIDPRGLHELFLWKGSSPIWRSGPWNGQRFSGLTEMGAALYNHTFVSDDNEAYFTTAPYNASLVLRMVLGVADEAQPQTWGNQPSVESFFGSFHTLWYLWAVREEQHLRLRPGAALRVFERVLAEVSAELVLRDWSDGWERRTPLQCREGDGYFRLGHVKLPAAWHAREGKQGSRLKECEEECSKDCSCTAYSSADIRGGGSGCFMWGGDLVDM